MLLTLICGPSRIITSTLARTSRQCVHPHEPRMQTARAWSCVNSTVDDVLIESCFYMPHSMDGERELKEQLIIGFSARFHGLLAASLNASSQVDSSTINAKLCLRERLSKHASWNDPLALAPSDVAPPHKCPLRLAPQSPMGGGQLPGITRSGAPKRQKSSSLPSFVARGAGQISTAENEPTCLVRAGP